MATYIRRTTFLPAAGKVGEMRPLLEEVVRRRQAQGYRAGLQRAEIAEDSPALAVGVVVPDIDTLEAYLQAVQKDQQDPQYRESYQALAALGRAPARQELSEQALPDPMRDAPAPRYLMRVTHRPLAGRLGDLRAAVVERSRHRQQQGARVTVQTRIAPRGGIVQVYPLEHLADWEQVTRSNAEDPGFSAFLQKEAELQDGPVTRELFEVLISLPPQS